MYIMLLLGLAGFRCEITSFKNNKLLVCLFEVLSQIKTIFLFDNYVISRFGNYGILLVCLVLWWGFVYLVCLIIMSSWLLGIMSACLLVSCYVGVCVIFLFDNYVILSFGNSVILRLCFVLCWRFCHVGFWRFSHLGFWQLCNLSVVSRAILTCLISCVLE